MIEFFCAQCGMPLILKHGFYSLYYQCSSCSNRITTHDAQLLSQINKSGAFRTNRLVGSVLFSDDDTTKIYVRKVKR